MRCQNCGRELKNGARFCIGCGAQHDENGQLIGGGNGSQDNHDYNKTMMVGSTGFQQYQSEQEQSFQQYNAYEQDIGQENDNRNIKVKKKISPIIIICPIIIVLAIAFSILSNKKTNKQNVDISVTETTVVEEQLKTDSSINDSETEINDTISTSSLATMSELKKAYYPDDGYWDVEAEHFYIGDEMQKDMWIGDYYVGHDGKKLTSAWTSDNYYVDATGKKVRNEWIEFSFLDAETGQKKIGYYFVDEDGKKVVNQIVDGRELDDTGTYIPKKDENLESEKIDIKDDDNTKLKESESVKDENKNDDVKKNISETAKTENESQLSQSLQSTVAPQISQISKEADVKSDIQETNSSVVASNKNNVINVASDGKGCGYQIIEESFDDKNVKSFKSIMINDANFNNLLISVNEWNQNRSHTGISNGKSIIGNNLSKVYDLKVERNDGKVFSVYEICTELDNDKTFNKNIAGYTWDAKSGQLLDLKDLFSEENYNTFTSKVLKKIKDNKNRIDSDIYEEIIASEGDELYEYCTWYMSNAGITLVFNKDSIGTNSVDGLKFSLQYSSSSSDNINKLLLSKYKS